MLISNRLVHSCHDNIFSSVDSTEEDKSREGEEVGKGERKDK